MTTLKTNYDYVNEYVLFYNPYFVIADSYTVIEPGLSEFKLDQSITYAELNQYMIDIHHNLFFDNPYHIP